MKEHLRGILDELCNLTELVFALAVIEFVLLLFSIGGMLYQDPGSAGYVVWMLNAAGLVLLLSLSVSITIMCFRR